MAVVDRYLVRQYTRVFLMTFISLLGIYVIADFVTNYSDFARMESDQGMGLALAEYYGARVPLFFEMCGRIVAVLACVFVVAALQERNELTALMAAGLSRWRVVQPLVLAVTVTAGLGVLNRELVLPAYRGALSQDVKDVVRDRPLQMVARFDDQNDVMFSGQALYLAESRIEQPRLRLPVYWQGVGQWLRAETAIRRPAEREIPAGYLLIDVTTKLPSQQNDLRYHQQDVVLTPADHAWLEPNQCFVVSSLTLEDFREGGSSGHYCTTTELLHKFRSGKLQYATESQVALHARFVQPALDMTLLFLSLPLALSMNQRHVFMAAGKCVGMVMVFAAVVLLFHGMGIQNIIKPSLAAWGPLIALVPIAASLSKPLRQ